MRNIFLIITLIASSAFAGRLQNGDFATLAELQSRGASATALLNDTKVYVSANGINKQLSAAIVDGDIGAGGGATGENLVLNPDFERDLLTWTPASATAVRTLYTPGSEFNKYYSLITTTQSNGTYSTPITISESLANGDIQIQSLVMPVSGTWSIQLVSGTTVVTSQTLTVSTNFSKSPIIFYPAGVASQTYTLRYFAAASGSILGIDNVYTGEAVNLKNGAVVEQFRPYTVTTIPGLGTIANSRFEYRRVGDSIEIQATFTTGTVTAALIQIPLPNGFTTSSSYPSGINSIVGKATRATAAAATFTILTGPNLPYLLYGTQSGGTAGINGQAGNVALVSGENVSFFATVKINNLTGSSTTFDTVCPNDISCTNTFGASITGAGVVSREGLDWISSCNGATPNVCTFNTNVFSATPVCNPTYNDPLGGSYFSTIVSSSSSTITIATYLDNGGAPVARGFELNCTRGNDFKAKETIEGFMSKTVTSTGNFIERSERARVALSCTTPTCIIANQSGAFNSITRSLTGTYPFSLFAGTYSDIPSCTGSCGNGVNTYTASVYMSSPTSGTLICDNGAAVTVDSGMSILCQGPR